MSFPYKKVLVIGATSGIGEALAARLVQEKSRVIVVGRRKERLDAFVDKYGKDSASAVPFDVLELEKIPGFAERSVDYVGYLQDATDLSIQRHQGSSGPRLRAAQRWYSMKLEFREARDR